MANTNPNKNRPEDRGTSYGQTGSSTMEKAQETAADVAERAKGMASSAAQSVGDAASQVGKRADDAAASVGGGMQSVAGTIRDKGPRGGMMGSATSGVANMLESGGRYLEEEGVSGMAEDVTNLVRRNPIPAVLIALGLGFLLAKVTRS